MSLSSGHKIDDNSHNTFAQCHSGCNSPCHTVGILWIPVDSSVSWGNGNLRLPVKPAFTGRLHNALLPRGNEDAAFTPADGFGQRTLVRFQLFNMGTQPDDFLIVFPLNQVERPAGRASCR